MKLSVILMCIL